MAAFSVRGGWNTRSCIAVSRSALQDRSVCFDSTTCAISRSGYRIATLVGNFEEAALRFCARRAERGARAG